MVDLLVTKIDFGKEKRRDKEELLGQLKDLDYWADSDKYHCIG